MSDGAAKRRAAAAAMSRMTPRGERDTEGRLLPLRYRVAEARERRLAAGAGALASAETAHTGACLAK